MDTSNTHVSTTTSFAWRVAAKTPTQVVVCPVRVCKRVCGTCDVWHDATMGKLAQPKQTKSTQPSTLTTKRAPPDAEPQRADELAQHGKRTSWTAVHNQSAVTMRQRGSRSAYLNFCPLALRHTSHLPATHAYKPNDTHTHTTRQTPRVTAVIQVLRVYSPTPPVLMHALRI